MKNILNIILKYEEMAYFFMTFFITDVIVSWPENYFLNKLHPTAFAPNDWTILGMASIVFFALYSATIYYISILVTLAKLGKKWYVILVATILMFSIASLLVLLKIPNNILSNSFSEWQNKLVYLFAINIVAYSFYASNRKVYFMFLAFLLIYALYDVMSYLFIYYFDEVPYTFNSMFYLRYTIYSVIFGFVYLVVMKYFAPVAHSYLENNEV